MIEIRNLTKDFGERRILENINLKVERGDALAVVGNSGCGKATLLRCMNLLTPPTSGQVFIGGEEITAPGADVDRIRRRIGMVYQNINLFSHLSALENVVLAPRPLNRLSRKQAAEPVLKPGQPAELALTEEENNEHVNELSNAPDRATSGLAEYDVDIVTYHSLSELLMALDAGQIQLIGSDEPTVQYILSQSGAYQERHPAVEQMLEYSMLFLEDSAALRDSFNTAIAAMRIPDGEAKGGRGYVVY